VAHPQIAAFARLAKENSRPTRLLAGQKTLLTRTMHDIRYDEMHDEFFVSNAFGQAIMVFRGGASGEEAPIRIIQGPRTQLEGSAYDGIDRLAVDPIHNEILVPCVDSILVFPRDGNGDVAPLRIIRGPDTRIQGTQSVAVDPVHDLIIVGSRTAARDGEPEIDWRRGGLLARGGALLIFNRTDNGNVRPRAIISGPKSGLTGAQVQIQTYPPKGWIVATRSSGNRNSDEQERVGYIALWSIADNGDVPPRWLIGGPQSMLKGPRGVALNPSNKEILVTDSSLNAVLTFYFPEIF